MMVGFNPLNPSARDRVFSVTRETDVAIEVMFAVRRALSRPDELARVAGELGRAGARRRRRPRPRRPARLPGARGRRGVGRGGGVPVRRATSPAVTSSLTGTGSVEHLEENVRSINAPPLPSADLDRLRTLFGHLDHLSGN